MVIVFSPIFVAGTKTICGYNFVAPLKIKHFKLSKYVIRGLIKERSYLGCRITHSCGV